MEVQKKAPYDIAIALVVFCQRAALMVNYSHLNCWYDLVVCRPRPCLRRQYCRVQCVGCEVEHWDADCS